MKKIYAAIIATSCCISMNAQDCYQAARAGGSQGDEGSGIAVDVNGNYIVTGSFNSPSIVFGSTTLSNAAPGMPDFYVAKYNSSGTFQWARRAGKSIDDVGKCVTTDASGNIYVGGYFGGDTIFFGTTYLVNSNFGNMDAFLVKYDPSGNVVWARKTGGASDEIPYAITIDGGGNVVMVGKHYGSSMSVGAFTVTNPGFGTNIFIARWDANGNARWLKGAGKADDDVACGISDDNGSGIYITGYFRADTLKIGTAYTVNSTTGNEEMFTARLDTTGTTSWITSIGGNDADMGYGIATDAAGNSVVTGRWRSNSITVGTSTYNSAGNYDIVVVMYNSSGGVVWSHAVGGGNEDIGRSVALDASSNVTVFGEFYSPSIVFGTGTRTQSPGGNDLFLVKYNSGGTEQSVTSYGTGGVAYAYGIAAGTSNDLYLGGTFAGSLTFGSSNVSSAGGTDVFFTHTYSFATSVNTISFVSCFGGTDGSVAAISSGGFSPFNYMWSNSQSTDTISGLGTGTYSVTVTDMYGCTAISNISLTEPAQLSVAVTDQDIDCSLGQNGMASASVSGGTSPYSYAWSNGDSTANLVNIAADSFFLVVTDANGCTENGLAVVNVVLPPAVPICMVTVDSASQHNVIMWDKTTFTMADSFIVYREIATNDYRRIGVRAFADSSYFIDTVQALYAPNTGNPNNGTYRYKLQMIDTCGVYGPLSPYHNTIYIINTTGTFSWPQLYTIENGPNPVVNYVLYRDDLSNGTWIPVASVAGTQQVVSDPNYATYAATGTWRVQTLWGINCTPTARFEAPDIFNNWNSSFSNMQGQAIIMDQPEVKNEPSMTIYPTVTDGAFTLTVDQYEGATVEVYSATGELISSSQLNAQQTQLDLSSEAAGMYFVTVRTVQGAVTQKVIRQ